ncbi:hypothetical protein [Escherichia coli]|uniref:hypothetical protein n=1 Tax=Escherichia coli TaxID=562 RepID=UPI00098C67A8
MKINQPAVAGTLESGDVMIRIAPLDTQDIDLQINSSVEKQFGPPHEKQVKNENKPARRCRHP